MSIDDLRQLLKEQPVETDEIRKRRVLARVLERRGETGKRPAPWVVGGLVVALVLAVVVVLIALDDPDEEPTVEPTTGRAAVEPPARDGQPSTLAIGEVGRAILLEQTDIAVDAPDADRVVVRQSRGRVRYEIDRPDGREVVVRVAGLTITVVGTVFTVAVSSFEISVSVEQGVVSITYGDREVEIVAGEEITIAADSVRDDTEVDRVEPTETAVNAPDDAREQASATTTSGTPETTPKESATANDSRPPEHTAAATTAPGEAGEPEVKTPTIEDLLARVDAARGRGALAEASRLLDQIVKHYPNDQRSINALFTMGKVERQRGNHDKAAKAFRRCWRLRPSGMLAEEARAEAAQSWADAGRADWAREAARRYLAQYPTGSHAQRMKQLLE